MNFAVPNITKAYILECGSRLPDCTSQTSFESTKERPKNDANKTITMVSHIKVEPKPDETVNKYKDDLTTESESTQTISIKCEPADEFLDSSYDNRQKILGDIIDFNCTKPKSKQREADNDNISVSGSSSCTHDTDVESQGELVIDDDEQESGSSPHSYESCKDSCAKSFTPENRFSSTSSRSVVLPSMPVISSHTTASSNTDTQKESKAVLLDDVLTLTFNGQSCVREELTEHCAVCGIPYFVFFVSDDGTVNHVLINCNRVKLSSDLKKTVQHALQVSSLGGSSICQVCWLEVEQISVLENQLKEKRCAMKRKYNSRNDASKPIKAKIVYNKDLGKFQQAEKITNSDISFYCENQDTCNQ